ncbi:NADH-quinone oxidoreductase subunit NuoK [Thermasporomyces composti]|jgi:NADH-quinone oxidoreductase subunit K|uniref:NADH-quinone oxidoreductase subunit K n=1 Tax=Thermasporomyces composti TaxID=696763 RepID=A0A3D9V8W4_THECX|nr:NADH-quinone oxidoreductase subunit K [Thermasporomyces composti]
MPLLYPLLVSTLLFAIGVYGVLARRNAILVLMGVELMLNAVNLNLVAFDTWHGDGLRSGQVLTLFVITIAAAEIGLGLAIVLRLFRVRAHVDVDRVRDLADRDGAGPETGAGPEVEIGDEWAGDRTGEPVDGSAGRTGDGESVEEADRPTQPARSGG